MFSPKDHTFVLCAYKRNPFIRQTIDCLMAQTVKGEIIMSTSTPSDYLEEICRDYGIQIVVNPSPHLAGDDWNYGYDAARTKLVTIAHQDDFYEPEFLEKTLEVLNRYPEEETSLAFTGYYELRNGKRVDKNAILRIKQMLNAPLKFEGFSASKMMRTLILAFGNPICCPAVTLVKSNLGDSPFDTEFVNSCDYKTWVDLAKMPGRFVYCPDHLMGHRIYEGSATTANIASDVRRKEDLEILSTLWPTPIARILNKVYATSENSNRV